MRTLHFIRNAVNHRSRAVIAWLLAAMLSLNTTPVKAQDPVASLNAELRSLFSALTNPTPGVRFLYDMSVKIADSSFYSSVSYDTSNVDNWFYLYDEMYHAAYDTTAFLRSDTVFARSNRRVSRDTIPIGIMNWRFNKLKPDALTTNTYFNFDTVANKLYDKSPRPSSPYLIDTLFAACPLIHEVSFANVVFELGPQFLFSDPTLRLDTRVLKIDFGDGLGWVTIPAITTTTTRYAVTYPSAGLKIIKVATFASATGPMVTLSTSSIKVLSTTVTEDPDEWINSIEGISVGIYNGCNASSQKKYIIYLEGLDILNDINVPEFYASRINDNNLANLRNFGYSFVVVNFNNPYASIVDNGQRVIKLLEYLRCLTPDPAPFVMIGESMGGLVGRYALTFMESPYYATNACSASLLHNTRLFITMDSPHDGANIPIGVQQLYRNLLPFTYLYSSFTSGMNSQYGIFLDGISSKQMLLYHVDSDVMPLSPISVSGYTASSQRSGLESTFDMLGDYPRFCKMVALSNGAFNGSNQRQYHNNITNAPRNPNDYLMRMKSDTYLKVLWFKIIGANTEFAVRTNPSGTGEVLKMSAGISHYKIKLKWFGVKIVWSSTDLVSIKKTAVGVKPYCVSAGSNLPTGSVPLAATGGTVSNPDWVRFLGYTVDYNVDDYGNIDFHSSGGGIGFNWFASVNFDFLAYSDGTQFGFIPVQSSFGYTPDALNRNLSADPVAYTMSRTPFDVIITNPSPLNRGHLSVDNRLFGTYQSCPGLGVRSSLLNREIGDDSLFLENTLTLPHGPLYEAERRLLVNYRSPYYNYPSVLSTLPGFRRLDGATYVISGQDPVTVGGSPVRLRANSSVAVNPAQPVAGPYVVMPGFMVVCCTSYWQRPAAGKALEAPLSTGYLKIYPNPVNGPVLNIIYQFKEHAMVWAEVHDMYGKLIDRAAMPFADNTQESHFSINLDKFNLPAGTYVLRLRSDKEQYMQKFVLTK